MGNEANPDRVNKLAVTFSRHPVSLLFLETFRPLLRIERGKETVMSKRNVLFVASITAALIVAALPGHAQLPKDPQERAKVIAQIMQANARQITLFDREGKEME